MMVATLVHIWVKDDKIDDFIKASGMNHEASIREPGNLRFDILQDTGDPSRFTFYEAYISEEAALAHKETQHYKLWRDQVADWMAKPRTGIKHEILFPDVTSAWKNNPAIR